MTCIVGFLNGDIVHMAGDHIGTDGYSREIQGRSKVFRNGDFLIGYTSSFRMGQILEHVWEPPKKSKKCKDVTEFMVKQVVPSLIACFDNNRFIRSINSSDEEAKKAVPGQACGGEFLVGYNGHLFKIESDFSVLECVNGYDSIGAGEAYSLGAFSALDSEGLLASLDPRRILTIALQAAEEHCALVAVDWDNFSVLSTEK